MAAANSPNILPVTASAMDIDDTFLMQTNSMIVPIRTSCSTSCEDAGRNDSF